MRDIGEGTIRRIDWTELTPVVLLLRIFNITMGLRILIIALIGLQLNIFLNFMTGVAFMRPELKELIHRGTPPYFFNVPIDALYSGVLDTNLSVQQLLLWLPGVVLIWTLCGGLICRSVALRLTIDTSESLSDLLLFLRKRGISLVSAPFLMLLAILCCFLPVKIAGWLLAVPVLNYVIAVLFPIPFAFALLTTILALVLAVGWMLLFAAVCVDGSDGFDAISRMFSYVTQRPLHYLLYWSCSGILGYLGFLLVMFLVYFTMHWCWNTVPADFDFIKTFWAVMFAMIPLAYVFAWFWTSSVAIYLLLRRSVDATPFQEVYRVSPPKVRTLPTIRADELGAPEIVSPAETPPQSP